MTKRLGKDDRLRLMKFICSFAWADLHVHQKERAFVHKMAKKLGLDDEENALVEGWLKLPPRADEVDPQDIPHEHRKLFLEAARAIVLADGEVDPQERINLNLLEELLQ